MKSIHHKTWPSWVSNPRSQFRNPMRQPMCVLLHFVYFRHHHHDQSSFNSVFSSFPKVAAYTSSPPRSLSHLPSISFDLQFLRFLNPTFFTLSSTCLFHVTFLFYQKRHSVAFSRVKTKRKGVSFFIILWKWDNGIKGDNKINAINTLYELG